MKGGDRRVITLEQSLCLILDLFNLHLVEPVCPTFNSVESSAIEPIQSLLGRKLFELRMAKVIEAGLDLVGLLVRKEFPGDCNVHSFRDSPNQHFFLSCVTLIHWLPTVDSNIPFVVDGFIARGHDGMKSDASCKLGGLCWVVEDALPCKAQSMLSGYLQHPLFPLLVVEPLVGQTR